MDIIAMEREGRYGIAVIFERPDEGATIFRLAGGSAEEKDIFIRIRCLPEWGGE